jgi:hypothetical protein
MRKERSGKVRVDFPMIVYLLTNVQMRMGANNPNSKENRIKRMMENR